MGKGWCLYNLIFFCVSSSIVSYGPKYGRPQEEMNKGILTTVNSKTASDTYSIKHLYSFFKVSFLVF